MSILDTIKERVSVRDYTNKDLTEREITAILEAARHSQSAKNMQDWRFIVVRDGEKRKKLAVAAKNQMFIADAPIVIACCGVGTEYIMTCGQHSYYIDVSIAMENMSLVAHELGLGTCWIGAFYENQVKAILGIPETDIRVVGMMTFGYPASLAPHKNRKSLSEISSRESW